MGKVFYCMHSQHVRSHQDHGSHKNPLSPSRSFFRIAGGSPKGMINTLFEYIHIQCICILYIYIYLYTYRYSYRHTLAPAPTSLHFQCGIGVLPCKSMELVAAVVVIPLMDQKSWDVHKPYGKKWEVFKVCWKFSINTVFIDSLHSLSPKCRLVSRPLVHRESTAGISRPLLLLIKITSKFF